MSWLRPVDWIVPITHVPSTADTTATASSSAARGPSAPLNEGPELTVVALLGVGPERRVGWLPLGDPPPRLTPLEEGSQFPDEQMDTVGEPIDAVEELGRRHVEVRQDRDGHLGRKRRGGSEVVGDGARGDVRPTRDIVHRRRRDTLLLIQGHAPRRGSAAVYPPAGWLASRGCTSVAPAGFL